MSGTAVITLPSELFAPAESLYFEGKLDMDFLHTQVDDYRFVTPLSWQVNVTNTGGSFLVLGSVQVEAQTSCARCLSPVSLTLDGEIEAYFLENPDEDIPEEIGEDEINILPENHEIDMVPLITQALLLALPLVPLCSPDCKGICPHCGANLNEGPCKCSEDKDEISDDNPFAVLKNIDFSDN
ncbi:MAG: YceD family protein [Eggerthellaceae bacterium]|jgi:uncharacterized protein